MDFTDADGCIPMDMEPLGAADMSARFRQIRLFGAVNEEMTYAVWAALRELEMDSPTELVTIFLNSQGGDPLAAFSIIDSIELTTCPVRIIGTGSIMSAALPILAAGAKGQRFVTPRTRLLIHPPRIVVAGSMGNAKEGHNEVLTVHKMYKDILLKNTNLKAKDLKGYLDGNADHYFSAAQAKKFGIIDAVLKQIP